MYGEFLPSILLLLLLFVYIYIFFFCMGPYSEYWYGSTKFLNTDPIWIRIHNTVFFVSVISLLRCFHWRVHGWLPFSPRGGRRQRGRDWGRLRCGPWRHVPSHEERHGCLHRGGEVQGLVFNWSRSEILTVLFNTFCTNFWSHIGTSLIIAAVLITITIHALCPYITELQSRSSLFIAGAGVVTHTYTHIQYSYSYSYIVILKKQQLSSFLF